LRLQHLILVLEFLDTMVQYYLLIYTSYHSDTSAYSEIATAYDHKLFKITLLPVSQLGRETDWTCAPSLTITFHTGIAACGVG